MIDNTENRDGDAEECRGGHCRESAAGGRRSAVLEEGEGRGWWMGTTWWAEITENSAASQTWREKGNCIGLYLVLEESGFVCKVSGIRGRFCRTEEASAHYKKRDPSASPTTLNLNPQMEMRLHERTTELHFF